MVADVDASRIASNIQTLVGFKTRNTCSDNSGTVPGIGAGVSGLESHQRLDRKSTRLNSSHMSISYAVFCLKKKTSRSQSTTNTSSPHSVSQSGSSPRLPRQSPALSSPESGAPNECTDE